MKIAAVKSVRIIFKKGDNTLMKNYRPINSRIADTLAADVCLFVIDPRR